MRLIAIPIDDDALKAWVPHWMQFLPMIAARTKEPIAELIRAVMTKEMRLALVWDEATEEAKALIGVRLHYRGDDLIAELLWTAGHGRQQWQHLLSELENLLRDAGVKECRPLCRPGWSRLLKQHGYKLTHVQMEKVL
jgi:hypothetical protein